MHVIKQFEMHKVTYLAGGEASFAFENPDASILYGDPAFFFRAFVVKMRLCCPLLSDPL